MRAQIGRQRGDARPTATIIGAGLTGPLLAIYLARRGYGVDLYERAEDPRVAPPRSGKSINLTLCHRGMRALDEVRFGDTVRSFAEPAYGRTVHLESGERQRVLYGDGEQALLSVSRSLLNRCLLDFAQKNWPIRFFFNTKCLDLALDSCTVTLQNTVDGRTFSNRVERLVAADGAFSAVRQRLLRRRGFNYSQEFASHSNMELCLPVEAVAALGIEPSMLNVWPRGTSMLIAFPNCDGSFTGTLQLPNEGPQSYAATTTPAALRSLFDGLFPRVYDALPSLKEEFFTNPRIPMMTVRCAPWSFGERILLLGDAAHSVYPSYGQGANACFEDCRLFDACLGEANEDWAQAQRNFEERRKPDVDALADISLQHFVDLRTPVVGNLHLLKDKIASYVRRMYPERFRSLYSLVAFTDTPYATALATSRKCDAILETLMQVATQRGLNSDAEVSKMVLESRSILEMKLC